MSHRAREPIDVEVFSLRSADASVTAAQRLDSRCFRGGERSDVASEIDRPFTFAWAARLPALDPGTDVVGYILTWHVADELHILNVATDPDHRRRGIGNVLVARAIEFAKENKVRLVLLEVRRGNQPAIRLYRSFGFALSGLRRGYYADDGEDAIEMVLVLDPETGDIVPGRDELRLEEV